MLPANIVTKEANDYNQALVDGIAGIGEKIKALEDGIIAGIGEKNSDLVEELGVRANIMLKER